MAAIITRQAGDIPMTASRTIKTSFLIEAATQYVSAFGPIKPVDTLYIDNHGLIVL